MDTVCSSTAAPVADIDRGERLAIGGSGLSGLPHVPIDALLHCGDGKLDIGTLPGVFVHLTAAPATMPAESVVGARPGSLS